MKIIYKTLALGLTAITLTACQSAPRAYNGQSGYQIESQTADSATLAYTLAGRQNQQLDANKLQRACQKVLGINKTFKLSILSINEIANPKQNNLAVKLAIAAPVLAYPTRPTCATPII